MVSLRSVSPPAPAATATAVSRLAALLSSHGPVLSLSGAGLSTDSGLPDYRSPHRHATPEAAAAAERARTTDSAFRSCMRTRVRYWARSFVGYPRLSTALPNAAHAALAHLHGPEALAITQNVDGLCGDAGLRALELHGTLRNTVCLVCGAREARATLQKRLVASNPHFDAESKELGPGGDDGALPVKRPARVLPDGDVELGGQAAAFVVPPCSVCGSGDARIMPDLVFYGGVVPRDTREAARAAVDAAGSVLVVGSTLATYSAFSLVKRAKEAGKKVAIINFGKSRCDPLADMNMQVAVGQALPALASEMGPNAFGEWPAEKVHATFQAKTRRISV